MLFVSLDELWLCVDFEFFFWTILCHLFILPLPRIVNKGEKREKKEDKSDKKERKAQLKAEKRVGVFM